MHVRTERLVVRRWRGRAWWSQSTAASEPSLTHASKLGRGDNTHTRKLGSSSIQKANQRPIRNLVSWQRARRQWARAACLSRPDLLVLASNVKDDLMMRQGSRQIRKFKCDGCFRGEWPARQWVLLPSLLFLHHLRLNLASTDALLHLTLVRVSVSESASRECLPRSLNQSYKRKRRNEVW